MSLRVAAFLVLAAVFPAAAQEISSPATALSAIICSAELNDTLASDGMEAAKHFDCYAEDAVLALYLPGGEQPVAEASGRTAILELIAKSFASGGYVATQHLMGPTTMDTHVARTKVLATHVRADGSAVQVNASWIDSLIETPEGPRIARREVRAIYFGTAQR